jgi:hypothetical protein
MKLRSLASMLVVILASACAPGTGGDPDPAANDTTPPVTLDSCMPRPLALIDSVAVAWSGGQFSGIVGPFEQYVGSDGSTLAFRGHSGSLDDYSWEGWYFTLRFTTPFARVPGTVLHAYSPPLARPFPSHVSALGA